MTDFSRRQNMDTKRTKTGQMTEVLPDFIPLELAAGNLGISERELRRDRETLRKKLKGDFGNKKYSKGLSVQDFLIVARFRQIAQVMGKKAAVDHLRVNGVDL